MGNALRTQFMEMGWSGFGFGVLVFGVGFEYGFYGVHVCGL